MSRYFSSKYDTLKPYVPGEQPRDKTYIKLNTNESPFPPSPKAIAYGGKAAENLQLYCDPECTALVEKMAQLKGIRPEQIFFGNGSDEVLSFVFYAFFDKLIIPEHTYSFYPVYCDFYNINLESAKLTK